MIRISLETVASKIHWMRSQGAQDIDRLLTTPRYIEGLCFLQAMSQLPGGLEKFCERFLDSSVEWKSQWPERYEARRWTKSSGITISEQFSLHLQRWCTEHSTNTLGDFCTLEFDWMFPGFLRVLSAYMDAYAEAELAKTADTTLRRRILFELEFARMSSPPVPMVLVSDTRHGKTTAVDTYSRAWPGRVRLVTVPHSNDEREFYAAHARPFGIELMPATKKAALRDWVQYILAHTGLFCLYDEAHYLVPVKYCKETPPQRLNWVRAQVIDRRLPCAFFCTPQSQEETLDRYVNATHYNMEQWLGRMPKPVLISDAPTYEDLIAVARARFSDFSPAAINELCDAAEVKIGLAGAGARLNGEGGFKIVELAGARARYLAAQSGRKVAIADVREAVAWAGAPLPQGNPQTKDLPVPARSGPGRRGGVADAPQVALRGNLSADITVPEIVA